MMSKWEYGGVYKKYNMDGIIEIGTGKVKVHNIFDELPGFMKEADCLFIDPPCSLGNINSFYTKAGRKDYQDDYYDFASRLFECIKEINPAKLFIEVFKSNKDGFVENCKELYKHVDVYETTYYHNKNNKCWVISCSNEQAKYPFDGMDEEDVIQWICKNVDYDCIGDLCMGRGLVGYHAFLNDREFVGTEINKKRLAVLLDNINKKIIANNC